MSAIRHARPRTPAFETLIRALMLPEAFPPDVRLDAAVSVIQTHASVVLLTAERVYKLKKPQDFGFLNYSTPARRRHFCALETQLNQELAAGVYLGVAPVLLSSGGAPRFGATMPPDSLPLPGARLDDARVIDYAVVMRRLPEEATLAALVRADTAEPALLTDIAQRIASFHAAHPVSGRLAHYGDAQTIAANWRENFDQMRPYIGRTLDVAADEQIRDYVERFLAERAALLHGRLREGRVRDCHGDLRMEHIYRVMTPDTPGYRLVFIDRIEFLDRFRYGDVAGEVAFLVMELESAGRADLAHAFVDAYVAASGDNALRALLPFYACYRAYVRGKVLSFQLDEPETPPDQRDRARERAASLFALAAHYATNPTRAQLVLIGGLMGTGKSTLASMLHDALGAVVISSDALRKQIAGLNPTQPVPAAFGSDIYSAEWNARTYAALMDAARTALAAGQSVVLDASFARQTQRLAALRVGGEAGAATHFIEAVCPEDVVMARLARRWRQRVDSRSANASTHTTQASDGRPELYAAQTATWEPYDAEREAGASYLRLDTTEVPAILRERLLAAVGLARSVCWMESSVPTQADERAGDRGDAGAEA